MRKNNRGQAIVEFALILPVLVVMVMGLLEFGLFFHAHINVTVAAREAARIAALDTSATNQTITAAALTTMPATTNLTVTVSPPAPRVTGLPVTVSVSLPHTFITPLIAVLMPANPYTITSSATARSE